MQTSDLQAFARHLPSAKSSESSLALYSNVPMVAKYQQVNVTSRLYVDLTQGSYGRLTNRFGLYIPRLEAPWTQLRVTRHCMDRLDVFLRHSV